MPLNLTTTLNGQKRSWPLGTDPVTIGRSSRHVIQIAHPTVSKDHAEIVVRNEGYEILDLGSRNKTRVNGELVDQPVPIKAGDQIEVGEVLIQVEAPAPEIAAKLSHSTSIHSAVRLDAQEVITKRTESGIHSTNLVHLLAEAGRMLVLPRPLRETCDQILEFVEQAVPASRMILLLRTEAGAEPVQIAARYRGGSTREPLALSKAIMKTVLEDCTSVIITDAAADPRFQNNESIIALAVHSALAVPLFDNEKVLGVLYADSNNPLRTFGPEQLEVLTLLANMAAVKITNSRLLQAEQERSRLEQELATAIRIQRGLLPSAPKVEGYEVHAFLQTCYEVGGDLYDFHRTSDGQLYFILGDVSGKGIGAALLMSSVMASARVLYDASHGPGELTKRLNAMMCRSARGGEFVTAFIGCLDIASGRLAYANAGHPEPLLIGPSGARRLLSTGPPLGVIDKFEFEEHSETLHAGDLVVTYSDGIPEARCGEDFYGEERLEALMANIYSTPELLEISRRAVEEVENHLQGGPREDDVTLVLLRKD